MRSAARLADHLRHLRPLARRKHIYPVESTEEEAGAALGTFFRTYVRKAAAVDVREHYYLCQNRGFVGCGR
jgi:hypothetical protein